MKRLAAHAIATFVLLTGSGCLQTTLPGRSFAGDAPKLSDGEVELRGRLRGHVDVLADEIGERHIWRMHALRRAADYVAGEFRAAGCEATFQEYTERGRPVRNVIAELPGTGRPSQVLIVGAHYDTVRGSPGADDNASGVAAVLELARALRAGPPLRRTVRLVAFVNEEEPFFWTERMGSRVYAARCKRLQENVVGMIALDMLGFYRDAPGSQRYPPPFNLSCCLLVPNHVHAVEFHVATTGDDGNDGSAAMPFATLRQARDAARGVARDVKPATVVVHGGTYVGTETLDLDANDSGVTWQAAPGEGVRVAGGPDLVFGNVFVRCGIPGAGPFGTIFSHGGHDLRVENNVFVDCKRPLGSAPWGDDLWKQTVDGGQDCHWREKLLKEVDITKPPYTTRYPELLEFMKPEPAAERVSRAKDNVVVRAAELSSGNWTYVPNQILSTNTDPGFVDAANGNYALRGDSEVFKRLPGFKPIPFDQIGPRRESPASNAR